MGHFSVEAEAQVMQAHKCPQGRKATLTSSDMQILHVRSTATIQNEMNTLIEFILQVDGK
jgi:hypothetical protein